MCYTFVMNEKQMANAQTDWLLANRECDEHQMSVAECGCDPDGDDDE